MTTPSDSSGGHFHFTQDIEVALNEIDQALRGFAGRVAPAVNQLNESLAVGVTTNPAGVEEFVTLLKGAVEQATISAREAGTSIQESLQRGLTIDFAPFEQQATRAVEAIQAIFQRGLSSGALHPTDFGALQQTLTSVSSGFKEQITAAAGPSATPDFTVLDRRTAELAQQMDTSATALAKIGDANAGLERAGQTLRDAVEEQARVQTAAAQRVAEAGDQDVTAQNEARVARNAAAEKVRLASEGVAAAEEELRRVTLQQVEEAFRRRQGEYNDPAGQRSLSLQALQGQQVGGDVERLVTALQKLGTISDTPLFRGLGVAGGDPLSSLQAGQHIQLPLSSFSSNEEKAAEFSRSLERNLLFQLEPGAKVLNAPSGVDQNGLSFGHEQESLSAGHFEVLRTEWDSEEQLYRVHIRALESQFESEQSTRAAQDRAFRDQMDREITPQQLVAESRVSEGNGLYRNNGPYGPLTVPLGSNAYGRFNDEGANPEFFRTVAGQPPTEKNPLGTEPQAIPITREEDPDRFARLEQELSIKRAALSNTTTKIDQVEQGLIRASELLALEEQGLAIRYRNSGRILDTRTDQGFQLRDNLRADGRTEAIPLGDEGTRRLQADIATQQEAASKLKTSEELEAEAHEAAAKATQELALGQRLATERLATAHNQPGGALALGNNNFQLSTGEFVKREGESARLITSGNELADAETGLKEKQARLTAVVDRRIAAEESTASGILQGFKGGFTSRGFESNGDPRQSFGEDITNLSATAGVLAKYSLAGEAVKIAAESLSQLREGTVKYTEEVENLNVFLGHLNDGLSSTQQASVDLYGAQEVGLNVAVDFNSAIAIGTAALAAYQEEIRNGANANDIFADSIQQAGVNAIITGQQADVASKQLIAVTQSYNTGSAGQAGVNDAIFNAQKKFGGDPAQISQAVAAAAPVASQGGIDENTLAAMSALINARSTQSGSQIASTIERLVSRSQNTQFLKALSSQGIADTGNVVQELSQLSEAYNKLDRPGQQALQTQLGSSRALTGLIPLLRSFSEVTDATANSFDDIGGAQDKANKHLETFGGQLQSLAATLKTLAVDVGTSGIFTPIGVALELIAPPLQIVTDLLGGFEKAIGPIGRDVGGLVVDLLLAAKAYSILQAAAAKEAASRAAAAAANSAAKAEFVGSAVVQTTAEVPAALSARVTQAQAAAMDAAAASATANAEAQALLKTTIDGSLPSVAALTQLSEAKAKADQAMIAEAYALNAVYEAEAVAAQGLFEAQEAVNEVTTLSVAAQDAATAAMDAHAAAAAAARVEQEAYNEALGLGASADEAFALTLQQRMAAEEAATIATDADIVALRALSAAAGAATANIEALTVAEAEEAAAAGGAAVTPRGGLLGRFRRGGGAAAAEGETAGAAGLSGGLLTTGFVVAGLAVVALSDQAVKLGRSLWEADQAMDRITHGSVDDLKASAERLATARSNINHESSGVLGSTVDYFEGHPAADKKKEIDAQIAELKVQSDQLSHAIALGSDAGKVPLPASSDDLKSTLQNLSDSGASADTVMKVLTNTLDGLTGASTRAANAITPGSLVLPQGQAGLTQGVLGSLKNIDLGTTSDLSKIAPSEVISADVYGDIDKSGIRQSLLAPRSGFLDFKGIDPTAEQQKAVREAITNTLSGLGKSDPGAILTPDDQKKVAQAAAQALNLRGKLAELEPGLEKALLAYLGQEAIKPLNAKNVRADPALLNDTVKNIIAAGGQRVSEASARGASDTELLSIQQKNLADLLHAEQSIKGAGLNATQLSSLTQGLAAAKKALFDAYAARVREVATAAESTLGNSTADQARKQAIEKQVASILTQANRTDPSLLSGDFNTLSGAQNALTNATLVQAHNAQVAANNLIKQALADADALAKEAARMQKAADAAFAMGEYNISAAAGNTATSLSSQSTAARARASTIKPVTQVPLNDPSAQPGITAAGNQATAAAAGNTDTAAQIAAAKYAASIFPGSQVGEASAAVRTARANLAAQARGTVAYYDALKTLHEAERSYANAILAAQANSVLLGLDRTNPVLVARAKLQEAQRKLNSDARGHAPSDVINADKLAVGDAQSAAEAAAFNQRFSDAQTNDQLGRISHAAYLQYLNNEHNRLTAIKHRTRQQQEELNQVDAAIQAANQALSGQFNLGDIKVPTVYEVRRAVTEGGAHAGYHAQTFQQVSNTVQVTINGSDINQVKQVIAQYLGPTALQRSGTTTQKV